MTAEAPKAYDRRTLQLYEMAKKDARYAKHLPPELAAQFAGVAVERKRSATTALTPAGRLVALAPLGKCANGGEDEDITPDGRCKDCGSGAKHVRECAVYGRVTWEDVGKTAMNCRTCQERGVAADGRGFVPLDATDYPKAPAARPAPTATGPRLISVPPLPKLRLARPRSDKVIVTVVTGAAGEAMHALSRPYHEAYARRVGADYVVLRDPPPVPDFPLSAKFPIGGVLDTYLRACFLDADAIPIGRCPNLFDLVGPGEFGFHDDAPGLRKNRVRSLHEEYHELRRVAGLHPARCDFIANTGVMVFDRSHREVLEPPTVPIPLRHCAEQNWFTARLHDLGARTRSLPSAANYQYWEWNGFAGLADRPPLILHFSGIVPHRSNEFRLAEMRKWAARCPAPEAPPWEPPPELVVPHKGSIDLRHMRWMRELLRSGRYRRVLQIGCLVGYSAIGILDAAASGDVAEVHLCDVRPTSELAKVVAHYGLSDRVTICGERSADVLRRDARYDLVFVDGDHTVETCEEELGLLREAAVPALFVHDTAPAAIRYGVPEGPSRVANALRDDRSYAVIHEVAYRHGERTERGMLFAGRSEDAAAAREALRPHRLGNGALAVVACHFNPAGYRRPVENLRRFRGAMLDTPGVELFVAELVYGDAAPAVPDAFVSLRAGPDAVLWQKERLLNLAVERLPARFEYVAWIDADILFRDQDWHWKAVDALRDFDAVQLWSEASLLGKGDEPVTALRSITAGGDHPGFAWAARRPVFPLFDSSVAGSGDVYMAAAFGLSPYYFDGFLPRMSPGWRAEWERYRDGKSGLRVTGLTGAVDHLWHGERSDRRYEERRRILYDMRFDPAEHLAVDPDTGLYRWKNPEGGRAFAAYFAGRREDGE